ncbi:NADH-dependent [FeFe] hydrogenase, group A6 [Clostridium oceanicum]|uniref:NADH-dependent [FeFe] hydrogenase, group A6 n=1 Tax=Clostridium oceanicum TaxID=1543 RepID=A0ABP3UXR5_9CLOT
MNMVNLIIDNKKVTVEENTTILKAAKKAGIKIPTLCYLECQEVKGNCRLCVVEIKGRNKLVPSCATPVYEGMEVITTNKRLREIRKTILELMLSNHPKDCLTCIKNGDCELQTLAYEYNIRNIPFEHTNKWVPIDNNNPAIVRDPNKCIKCGRCIEACHKVQDMGIINFAFRSHDYTVTTAFNKTLDQTKCLLCGQCVLACPVGALYEKEDSDRVWDAIYDDEKHVIVQTAPAVRVALGEEFGLDKGTIVTNKMVAALKKLGFDKVFDTNFAADLTIMEEANELIYRIKNDGVLPMMTSCCPGWINFVEKNAPDLIPNLSTCKSPHEMLGSITKTYYAKVFNVDPSKIFMVSVMPCTAKKYESAREELSNDLLKDVDAVLTTRELGRMLKESGIDLKEIESEEFDSPLGESTGAGNIFGSTGGVMEAALRTAYEAVTGKVLCELDFKAVRGMDGIKEASVKLNDVTLNIAVVNGIKNAKKLEEKINSNQCNYHFVEVMTCPGGCVNGGGQPPIKNDNIKDRLNSLYEIDKNKTLRKSHENPDIIKIYDEFLEEPLSHISHKLLHTKYINRK